MSQKQWIATRGFPHDVCAQTLKAPAKHHFYQRNALVFRERLKLQTLQVAVLPQRGDSVVHRFTVANGGENAPGSIDRDLMQQGRGESVQQVSVLDDDDGIPMVDQGFPRCSHQRGRIGRCQNADQGGNSTERDAA
jgi:hypothetical protein